MKPSLVVLAAGMGSRYGGIKQIDPVGANGETLLDYSCFDAKQSGFGKVVFIIRPDIEKDFRERLFDRIAKNMDAQYVFQTRTTLLSQQQILDSSLRTKPWGTVHAVLCAKNAVNTPFTIINADDYYGREAYSIQGKYLSTLSNTDTCHSMVGYILKNTMSPVGTVSRGLCKVKDGYLESMVENTKIEFDKDGVVSHMPYGDDRLTGNEIVSMNFFGFTPAAFDYMQEYWKKFIEKNSKEPKAECLLPNCAGEIVTTGNGSLKVFSTSEKWFGMTYKEDRETVRKSLAQKTAEGFYPEKLWS